MTGLKTVPSALNRELTFETVVNARRGLWSEIVDGRRADGAWEGRLSNSALSTATAISALSFWLKNKSGPLTPTLSPAKPGEREQNGEQHPVRYGEREQNWTPEELAGRQIDAGFRWLRPIQNSDGGWGDTPASYSNISTTLLVIAAIHAADVQEDWSPELQRAWDYVNGLGGVDGVRRRYGADKTFSVPILASAAMSGIVPWREVGVMPFEAACVPQGFYNLVRMPVVSYAVPALVAIGQVKFVHDPPWNPVTRLVRQLAFRRATGVLRKMQPESGGYLEAVPLTSFVTMALCCSGRADHPVIQSAVKFLLESFRPEGSWPIDTNLATWNTTLTINALAADWETADAPSPQPSPPKHWRSNSLEYGDPIAPVIRGRGGEESDGDAAGFWDTTIEWLLNCQMKRRHPFTGAAPGGWGWTDLSGSVPDADDTPGAMLALKTLLCELQPDKAKVAEMQAASIRGAGWLLDLQNRDGGWPTFCRGWGRFPFDRSGADITAHVIRGLIAWREQCDTRRVDRAMDRGFRFMASKQNADGSWFPLWFGNQDVAEENNPVYGTAKVLMAWRDCGRMNDRQPIRGLQWLLENQRPNGSWGGGISVGDANDGAGEGTVEETSLAVEILCDGAMAGEVEPGLAQSARESALRGGKWLVDAITRKELHTSRPIGFYFAKLWYDERHYPFVFALAALGKLGKLVR